jgi:Uma2 family endonuclease
MSSVHSVPRPLVPGQRLTREEFLRRWEEWPEIKNAELIDGVVYMPSPVSSDHRRYSYLLSGWLTAYAAATPGCEGGSNGTWLMLESAPQPDVDLRILPALGGQSRNEGPYCGGAPELVIEVCGTSAAYDLGPKLALYQRAGVREYLTLVIDPPQIVWRELHEGRYRPIPPGPDGILRSTVFPGLWLEPEAALAGDAARVLAVLQQGLASAEHQAFVDRLAKRVG